MKSATTDGQLPPRDSGVVIVADSIPLPEGGAATNRIINTAKMYNELGYTPFIVSLYPPVSFSDKQVRKSGEVSRIKYRQVIQGFRGVLGVSRVLTLVWAHLNLWCLLNRFKPRVVHAYCPSFMLTVSLKLLSGILRCKLILEIVEWIPAHPGSSKGWVKRVSNFFFRRSLLLADGVVVISDFIHASVNRLVRKHVSKDRIIKIPILVDEGENPVAGEEQPGIPYFLWAGDLGYMKSIDFLLDSFHYLLFELNTRTHKLYISGYWVNPLAVRELKLRIAKKDLSPYVSFLGYVEHPKLMRFYRGASALLVPLDHDERSRARFPSKIAECLSVGTPIVASAVGEINTYFVDGLNAFIVPPGDVRRFAEAMKAVVDEPSRARAIGARGKQLCSEQFQLRANSRRLGFLLRSLELCAE